MAISFHAEDIDFRLKPQKHIKESIKELINNERKKMGNINFIFVSDNKILEINKQFLNHDYVTDIITFDYCEKNMISGDLFISIDCVKSNALKYHVPFENELTRVMIHGILHLLGYNDKLPDEQIVMKRKEDEFLVSFDKSNNNKQR